MINRFILLSPLVITLTHPHLNPKGPIHGTYAVDCLEHLAVNQFKYINIKGKQVENCNVQLLTIVTTSNLTSPGFEIQQRIVKKLNNLISFNIEIIEDGRNDFGVEMLTEFYLMVVDSVEVLEENLRVLTGVNTSSSEALYLVYYSNLEKNPKERASLILEKFWHKFINNVLVLTPKSLKELDLYTLRFDLHSGHNCLHPSGVVFLETCTNGLIRRKQNYYRNKSVRNFFNCTVDVIANKIDPFVISESEGFEIIFLKEVGHHLNIFFNVTLSGEDSWGVKEDGRWTNGLRYVQEEAFLGIGNFYVDPEYDKDFDFTVPHFDSELIWIVPIALYMPHWRVLTIIFTWYLWFLCICLTLGCALMMKLTSLSVTEFKSYKDLGYDLLTSFQVIITVPVVRQPRFDLTRICFVSLAIFSIIISSLYTSNLIRILTLPQREPQVDSIEGVFDKGWDIGGLPVYEDIFGSEDDKSKRIRDIFQVNESIYIWLTSVADDRDTCTIGSKFFIEYMLAMEDPLVTEDGRPKIFMLNEKIFTSYLNIVAMNGFPFLERINDVIGLMNSFGLVKAVANKYTYILSKVKEMQEERSEVEELTLDHLQGAFAVLITGYLSGTAFLLMEIVIFMVIKTTKKNNPKRIKKK